jgi:hypothetical protein
MSVTAWSILWQIVIAGTCVAFFGLAAYITLGAVRDARDMFRDLRATQHSGHSEDRGVA